LGRSVPEIARPNPYGSTAPRWTRTPPPAAPLAGVVVHESDRLRGERLLADLELEGVLAGRERALPYVHGPETMEVVARLHRRRGRAGEVDRVRTVEYVLPALRRGPVQDAVPGRELSDRRRVGVVHAARVGPTLRRLAYGPD